MMYKILAVKWKTGLITVGIVAYKVQDDKWNAVVGVALGADEALDIQFIAAYGAKLSYKEAAVFFPQFDISQYKYYPDDMPAGKEVRKNGKNKKTKVLS